VISGKAVEDRGPDVARPMERGGRKERRRPGVDRWGRGVRGSEGGERGPLPAGPRVGEGRENGPRGKKLARGGREEQAGLGWDLGLFSYFLPFFFSNQLKSI
jgi:hypothetical protein